MKIHLVTGTCGSYSDTHEWNVKAFVDPKAASDLVTKLDELTVRFDDHHFLYEREYAKERDAAENAVHVLDPHAVLWEKPTYSVEEIELVE